MNLLLSLLVTLSLAAPGEGPCADGERPPPPHVLLIESADALGLDAETVAAIEAIAEEARPEMEALHQALERADEAGREAAREAMHETGHAVMEDILAQLTEEQRAAAMEILPPPPGEGPGPR